MSRVRALQMTLLPGAGTRVGFTPVSGRNGPMACREQWTGRLAGSVSVPVTALRLLDPAGILHT
jgi:hypothetical protein